MLKKRMTDAETTAKKELSQSNPRKQEVIPATNFEYSKICVMLRKVADDLCNEHFIGGGQQILQKRKKRVVEMLNKKRHFV
jgi:hypothetical protein